MNIRVELIKGQSGDYSIKGNERDTAIFGETEMSDGGESAPLNEEKKSETGKDRVKFDLSILLAGTTQRPNGGGEGEKTKVKTFLQKHLK